MKKRQAPVNTEILTSTSKPSNFDLVAGGVCPHDRAKLLDEVRTGGIGVTRICKSCGHTWYLNKKIRVTKCQTCASSKRKVDKDVADEAKTRKASEGIRTPDPRFTKAPLYH